MTEPKNLIVASSSTPGREVQGEVPAPPERALIGSLVELISLDQSQAAELFDAAADRAIWRWMPFGGFDSIEGVRSWIAQGRKAALTGSEEPYAIVERSSGCVVGATRFCDIRPRERSVEIGPTWLATRAQRTGLNLEAKYLMLRHAFEDCNVLRVAFFCDEENGRARASLVRIGATYEGTLRLHRSYDTTRRNSAAYSIIAPEWPQVRAALEQRFLRAARLRQPFRLPVMAERKRVEP